MQGIVLLDMGTHWGNIRVTLRLYWDNGKENGNFYSIMGYIQGLSITYVVGLELINAVRDGFRNFHSLG